AAQRAVAIIESAFGPRSPHLVPALVDLGRILTRNHRFADAETAFARIETLPDGAQHAMEMNALRASAMVARGDLASAAQAIDSAGAKVSAQDLLLYGKLLIEAHATEAGEDQLWRAIRIGLPLYDKADAQFALAKSLVQRA